MKQERIGKVYIIHELEEYYQTLERVKKDNSYTQLLLLLYVILCKYVEISYIRIQGTMGCCIILSAEFSNFPRQTDFLVDVLTAVKYVINIKINFCKTNAVR